MKKIMADWGQWRGGHTRHGKLQWGPLFGCCVASLAWPSLLGHRADPSLWDWKGNH